MKFPTDELKTPKEDTAGKPSHSPLRASDELNRALFAGWLSIRDAVNTFVDETEALQRKNQRHPRMVQLPRLQRLQRATSVKPF